MWAWTALSQFPALFYCSIHVPDTHDFKSQNLDLSELYFNLKLPVAEVGFFLAPPSWLCSFFLRHFKTRLCLIVWRNSCHLRGRVK